MLRIHVTKKQVKLAAILSVVLIITIFSLLIHRTSSDGNIITKAMASRMLTLLIRDDFSEDGGAEIWFEKYMDYLSDGGFVTWFGSPREPFVWGEFKSFIESSGIGAFDMSEYTGVNIDGKKDSDKVDRQEFLKLYDYMVVKGGNDAGVERRELTIVGTPSNMTGEQVNALGPWKCVAVEGIYRFDGLNIDPYSDSVICVYLRGNSIVWVITQVERRICYENVWISHGSGNNLKCFLYGIYRDFPVGSIGGEISDEVGDLHVEAGCVKKLTLKKDTIHGKVLKVGERDIEVEGYGKVPLDDNFRVYKNYGVFEEKTSREIVVGYDLADFVVADGRICAAVLKRELNAAQIRVLIMSSGYSSIFHERVTITSKSGLVITKGTEEVRIPADTLVDIYPESDFMTLGRISIRAEGINEKITVLSVERSCGNPEYVGSIEIESEPEGLIIINELPLEEYLYAVVPSEMPNGFGVEALKVQAVCARSYACRHLYDNSYRMYGAHVDDSVNYQVYNNIEPQADSTQAVKETYGEVISRDGNVISAYYFSTSCGHTSDLSLWGGESRNDTFIAQSVSSDQRAYDLSNEEEFKKFILSENPNDYDYGFPFYRWSVNLSLEYITNRAANYGVNVGEIKEITVQKRSSGGAVKELAFLGTAGTHTVSGELNIRNVLGAGDNLLNTHGGEATTFYILPSAYVYLEPVYENDVIVSYNLYGGGYGHGIGMSQNAVYAMTRNGMTYDEILAFFYKNVELTNIYGG